MNGWSYMYSRRYGTSHSARIKGRKFDLLPSNIVTATVCKAITLRQGSLLQPNEPTRAVKLFFKHLNKSFVDHRIQGNHRTNFQRFGGQIQAFDQLRAALTHCQVHV